MVTQTTFNDDLDKGGGTRGGRNWVDMGGVWYGESVGMSGLRKEESM